LQLFTIAGAFSHVCLQKQAEVAMKRDAERSEREEMESKLKIDNEERMNRLATFQELASNRMAKQQQTLGPLMVNLKQTHAELTEAENLQVLVPARVTLEKAPFPSVCVCCTRGSQTGLCVSITLQTQICLHHISGQVVLTSAR
jgi:hypothetical protein